MEREAKPSVFIEIFVVVPMQCVVFFFMLVSCLSEEEEGWLLLLEDWWRCMEMKVGFWIRDFHVLQTEVQVTMDLTGGRMRTWVRISRGRESHIASLFFCELLS